MASPPPYDFKTAPPSAQQYSSNSKVPIQGQQPFPQQPPPPSLQQPRFLHIYLDGMTHRHLTIKDEDKRTPLYTVAANSGSIFSSKPHMRIFRGASPEPSMLAGTADFHTYSRTVDLIIHGRMTSMEATGLFTRGHVFESSIGPLKWEGDGIFSADLVLVNDRKEWIAKFHNSGFSLGKEGKLEISNGEIAGSFLDEIVVSGLGMVEQQRRSRNNSVSWMFFLAYALCSYCLPPLSIPTLFQLSSRPRHDHSETPCMSSPSIASP